MEEEVWQKDDLELHNSYPDPKQKLPFGGSKVKRKLGWKIALGLCPLVNLAVTPLYLSPAPDSIRQVLQTLMIVNAVGVGRMFVKEDLSSVPDDVREEFLGYLSGFSKLAINAFSLNIILLAVVVLANPARGWRRSREVWNCVRWGVVLLIWLVACQVIFLFLLYGSWGRIVYNTDRLGILARPGGIVVSVLQLLCILIAAIAIPGEVLLDIGEVYRIGLRKKGEGCCPFISTLKHMPATQTTLALKGMTYERLKHYKDQPLILMDVLSMAGLSSADCVDVISAVQNYT